MRARYYGGEPLAMVTCISGSKCVTRLIKILCDLLRRTERDREREKERVREGEGSLAARSGRRRGDTPGQR